MGIKKGRTTYKLEFDCEKDDIQKIITDYMNEYEFEVTEKKQLLQ